MSTAVASDDNGEKTGPKGSQTLLRGLDILDQVVDGPIALAELSARMGLTRSTTHRLATAMIDRGFLIFMPRKGYPLGPQLPHLGLRAHSQVALLQLARPYIEAPAARRGDPVHLRHADNDR